MLIIHFHLRSFQLQFQPTPTLSWGCAELSAGITLSLPQAINFCLFVFTRC